MNPAIDFMSQGGEMGALMRAHDWTATPLGPPAHWPWSLKSTLRLVLTSNHPMFIWWGPQLIQFYNDAYRATMGPERHPGALGQGGRACWDEIWDIIGPQIDSVMAGGDATWNVDQLVPVTRHGQREDVWWTYGYSPIQDAEGVRGVLVVCNDVTTEHVAREELVTLNRQLREQVAQRERAEAERSRSEQAVSDQKRAESERLKAMFSQAPGFVCILSGPQHVYEFANTAYRRLVGERPLTGKTAREALPEVAGQGFFELLDEVYASATAFSAHDVPLVVQRAPDAPPSASFVDFIYQPILGADGRATGIFVEGFDATERHQAKAALEASEERLQEGMQAARMVVWDQDLRVSTIQFSANAAAVFGASWTSVPDVWSRIPAEDLARLNRKRDAAIASLGSYDEMIRLVRPDNGETIWLQVHGNVIGDAGGRPLSIRGVSIDVTERKRAEEALRQADRRKDGFLAMLAHELRNPLAPISAAAQLLRVAGHDERLVRKSSDVIGRQVEHMTSLISDMLDVSRVNTGLVTLEREPVDIGRIIDESVEQVRPFIEARGHRLELEAAAAPAIVAGDRKRLVQVLTNLLQNAAKFTPEGGTVSLRVERGGDAVVVSVCDSGIGIDAELLPHVFELFTQGTRSSDRSQGGLGLGLALVKSLVGLHGGQVGVASEGAGKGSTFTVSLPLAGPAEESASFGRKDRQDGRPAGRLRLLVVDDNVDAAHMLSMFLREGGHEVAVEHSASAVLERAESETADVYLLDIGLPGMDGNELARRLRARPETARATLIAVTGYGQEYDRNSSIAAGFDHYFVKPADTARLLALLSDIQPLPRAA